MSSPSTIPASRARDTSERAEAVQLALLRQTSPAHRIMIAAELSATTLSLSRRALERTGRYQTSRELDLALLALNYGQELADRVQTYLEQGER